MALTKQQAEAHRKASQLVDLSRDLTEDEREYVLDHWQASATATHNLDGAYFTPRSLAGDVRFWVSGEHIIDLCAGIGRLAFHTRELCWEQRTVPKLTCVESNPAYVQVGRKVLPEARWIQGDVLNLPADLGAFDWAISNPPFGATPLRRANYQSSRKYTGRRFEYHVIEIASNIAREGTFILPQQSAPVAHSGRAKPQYNTDPRFMQFVRETGIELESVSLETTLYADDWHGVRPIVEVVTCNFTESSPLSQTVLAGAALSR